MLSGKNEDTIAYFFRISIPFLTASGIYPAKKGENQAFLLKKIKKSFFLRFHMKKAFDKVFFRANIPLSEKFFRVRKIFSRKPSKGKENANGEQRNF